VFGLIKPRQQSILGIDISSSSIKILQIWSDRENNHNVEGYGASVLPENAMEGAIIKDIDAVADTIRNVVLRSNLSSNIVALAVPDSSAISKIIQISEGLTEADIEELVVIEAEKYIPYPIDEVNIDFNVLGPSSKNAALQDLLMVASRAEIVNSRVEAVFRAGLDPKVVDVESFAVERAAQLLKSNLPAGGENKVVAIFDIGAMFSHLFVLHNMRIIYTHDEEFGGNQLTNATMQHYGLSYLDATEMIQKGNYPDDFEASVLTAFNDKFFIQIKRALQFFFSNSQYSFVDQIVLVGGVARQSGIASLLQDHLAIPTIIGNPLAMMSYSKTVDTEAIMKESPSLMIACGLALRHIE
jgi:type IV pilus assembly protein PilM